MLLQNRPDVLHKPSDLVGDRHEPVGPRVQALAAQTVAGTAPVRGPQQRLLHGGPGVAAPHPLQGPYDQRPHQHREDRRLLDGRGHVHRPDLHGGQMRARPHVPVQGAFAAGRAGLLERDGQRVVVRGRGEVRRGTGHGPARGAERAPAAVAAVPLLPEGRVRRERHQDGQPGPQMIADQDGGLPVGDLDVHVQPAEGEGVVQGAVHLELGEVVRVAVERYRRAHAQQRCARRDGTQALPRRRGDQGTAHPSQLVAEPVQGPAGGCLALHLVRRGLTRHQVPERRPRAGQDQGRRRGHGALRGVDEEVLLLDTDGGEVVRHASCPSADGSEACSSTFLARGPCRAPGAAGRMTGPGPGGTPG